MHSLRVIKDGVAMQGRGEGLKATQWSFGCHLHSGNHSFAIQFSPPFVSMVHQKYTTL